MTSVQALGRTATFAAQAARPAGMDAVGFAGGRVSQVATQRAIPIITPLLIGGAAMMLLPFKLCAIKTCLIGCGMGVLALGGLAVLSMLK